MFFSVVSCVISYPYLCRKLLAMEYISKIVELISAFRSETRQDAITPDSLGSLLLRMINALRYAWSSSTHPLYHIQCDTKDGRLIVKHPTDLMQKGCDSPLSYPLPFQRSANSAAAIALCFSVFISLALGFHLWAQIYSILLSIGRNLHKKC